MNDHRGKSDDRNVQTTVTITDAATGRGLTKRLQRTGVNACLVREPVCLSVPCTNSDCVRVITPSPQAPVLSQPAGPHASVGVTVQIRSIRPFGRAADTDQNGHGKYAAVNIAEQRIHAQRLAQWDAVHIGGIRFAPSRRQVSVCDQRIPLTPTEYRLLLVTMLQSGHAFTRHELVVHAIDEDDLAMR